MILSDDTIVAVSTPPGEGGIGIVRISGSRAIPIAERVFSSPKGKLLENRLSHTIIHGYVVNPENNERIDEVLVTVMKSPHTYTKEDVVEINCHGGMIPLRNTFELLVRNGARIAEPGEFTLRAFLNGRIDLSQAEAVIDIIRARTEQAERIAVRQLGGGLCRKIEGMRDSLADLCMLIEATIDFSEDEIGLPNEESLRSILSVTAVEMESLIASYRKGRLLREGITAAIIGKPNVGKSSLLNTLVQRERAIVTEMPGTTRDIVEDVLIIGGIPMRILDTAGIRNAEDIAEREGIRRSLVAAGNADMVLAVFDAGRPLDIEDEGIAHELTGKRILAVINKCDMKSAGFSFATIAGWFPEGTSHAVISALTGEGIEQMKEEIFRMFVPDRKDRIAGTHPEDVIVSNARHVQALEKALKSLREAGSAIERKEPPEITALFLRESLLSLGEITGAVSAEDILNRIFGNFCVGK